jgi:hypothetical protein
MSLWSFQGARGTAPALRFGDRLQPVTEEPPEGGLSKLNSVVDVEVDVVLGTSIGRLTTSSPEPQQAKPAW